MSKNIDKNNTERREAAKALEWFGLNQKEALVYMALLPQGEVGSSRIVATTGLHGQFVYDALAGLERNGLVTHVTLRGRKKFSAVPPARLRTLLQRQTALAEDAVRRMEAFASTAPLRFETFQGPLDAADQAFTLLRQTPPGSELCVIGGPQDEFSSLLGNRRAEFEMIRRHAGITIRYIGSESQRADFSESGRRRYGLRHRMLPAFDAGRVVTQVWPEHVVFCLYDDPMLTFVLASKSLADSHRTFFDALWRLGKE